MRCSDMLGIESEVTALSFDLACSERLLEFDNKREFERLKAFKNAIKEAVSEMFGNKPNETENDAENDDQNEDDLL